MAATLLVTATLLTASAATVVEAQACRSARPHVVLSLEGEWPAGLPGGITAELRAALETREIELCLAPPERPVARVTMRREGEALVSISIGDAITDKRVERDLDLRAFPPETRALALAIAADELLRASWAELLLVDAPAPAMPPPPAVREALSRSIPALAPPSPSAWAELSIPVERFGGGDLWLGASLRAERWWAERIGLRVGVGGRASPKVSSDLGSIQARALVAELDVLVGFFGEPRDGWHLGGLVGLWTTWARYRGAPTTDAVGGSASGAAFAPRGALFARHAFGPVRLGVELGLGYASTGVAATVDGARSTGSHGLLLHGALTFGVRL